MPVYEYTLYFGFEILKFSLRALGDEAFEPLELLNIQHAPAPRLPSNGNAGTIDASPVTACLSSEAVGFTPPLR